MIDIVIQLIWSVPLIILATTAAVLAYRNNPAWGWFLFVAALVNVVYFALVYIARQ